MGKRRKQQPGVTQGGMGTSRGELDFMDLGDLEIIGMKEKEALLPGGEFRIENSELGIPSWRIPS